MLKHDSRRDIERSEDRIVRRAVEREDEREEVFHRRSVLSMTVTSRGGEQRLALKISWKHSQAHLFILGPCYGHSEGSYSSESEYDS